MGHLRELLATDQRQVLEFFALHLKDVSGPAVDREDLLYTASVLAHHALVSTHADVELSAPANLSAVFDHFVFDTSLFRDGAMMETAGAQCLVLTGFFEDQLRRRHNIRWYAELGAGFFSRARHGTSRRPQSAAARCRRQALRVLAPALRPPQPRSAGSTLPVVTPDGRERQGSRPRDC